MPSINVSEADFTTLANAAMEAKARGEMDEAHALDKIARKTNAALSNSGLSKARRLIGGSGKSITWEEVPSTLI